MFSRGVVCAAALALLANGCSLVATTGAPSQIAGPKPPDCTTSKLPVYADGTLSGGAVGVSLFLGLAALASDKDRHDLGYATLYTFLASIPFAVSGIIGGSRVRSCRKAQDTWRLMQQQPAPPPPGPYAPPYAPPWNAPAPGAPPGS